MYNLNKQIMGIILLILIIAFIYLLIFKIIFDLYTYNENMINIDKLDNHNSYITNDILNKVLNDEMNYISNKAPNNEMNDTEEIPTYLSNNIYYDKYEFHKKKIYQIYISKGLSHFEKIKKNYQLNDYNNKYSNLLVFGVYFIDDLNIIRNHKGTVYIMWGGTDADDRVERSNEYLEIIKNMYNVKNIAISENLFNRLIMHNLDCQKLNSTLILIDPNIFKPLQKYGNSIYIYNGYSKGNEWIYGKDIYEDIIQKLPQFNFIKSNELNKLKNEEMPNIYKNCFIGLRLTKNDGLGMTILEMNLMNIPVIHNGDFKESIKWEDTDDILKSILNVHSILNSKKKMLNLDYLKVEKEKTFTIIIPSYNSKELISNAIQSVLNQTYNKWELIIIDDCSTDGSYKFVENYINNCELKNKIKLLKTDMNVGPYICMNIGILNSKGEYITRLDSDDILDKNKLLKEAIVLNNKNIFICNSKCKRIDVERYCEITISYKKFIISMVGFYDSIRFGADTEFYDRIKKIYNNNVYYINEMTYYYIPRQNSLTTSNETGLHGNGYNIRLKYVDEYIKWHNDNIIPYMPFDILNCYDKNLKTNNRPFPVPNEII